MAARKRRKPPDEALGRFGYLVAAVVLFEFAVLLWVTGLIRPLG
jgi:hypothetical protein